MALLKKGATVTIASVVTLVGAFLLLQEAPAKAPSERNALEEVPQTQWYDVESQALKAPAAATEANMWVQIQCHGTECATNEAVIHRISADGIIEDHFEATDYVDSYLANEVRWSVEYAPISCDDRATGCATFLPPLDAFDMNDGLAVTIPEGFYAGLLSCDITKECSTPVEEGKSYATTVELCSPNDNHGLLQVRTGFDFLRCRGGSCTSGTDEFLSSSFTDWAGVEPGQCIRLNGRK